MPYLAHLWVFWRETEGEEGAEVELRVVMATEGEWVSDNTLEERENFTLLAKSDELNILDKSEILITISGNLEPISDSAHKLVFRPFIENRATLGMRRKETTAPAAGKVEVSTDCEMVVFTMPINLQMGGK